MLGLDSRIDKDSLYDEFVDSKAFFWSRLFRRTQAVFLALVPARNGSSSSESAVKRSLLLYQLTCFRFFSAALSVPGSNAFCERVFSLMNSKWRAERNRALVVLIKSALQVCLNFGMKCTDFHGFALTDSKC